MISLDDLPPELHRHLLNFMDLESASRCRCICKALRRSMGCGIFTYNFITLKDLPKMHETLSRGPSKIAVRFKNVPLLMTREEMCIELFKALDGVTNIVALDMRGLASPPIIYKFSNLPNLQNLAVINNYDSFKLITTLTRLYIDSSPFDDSIITSTNLQDIRCHQQSFELSSLSPNLTTKLHANIRKEDINLLRQFTNLKNLRVEGTFDFYGTSKVELPLFTRLESLVLGSDVTGSIDHIVSNYMHLTKLVINLSCFPDPTGNVDRFSQLQQLKTLLFIDTVSRSYSMQFLQYLTNLEQLTVDIMKNENLASSITSQKLTSLRYNCGSDLHVIFFTHLRALQELRVGDKSKQNVIDAPQENLTFLKTVSPIATPLKNLQRLKRFGNMLADNEDFPPSLHNLRLHDGSRLNVVSLTNLTSLDVYDDMLEDLNSLQLLTRLRTLILFVRSRQDLQPAHQAEFLTKLTNLEKLVWHQRIQDEDFLGITEHLTRLTYIGVRYTSSHCSTALTNLTNLEVIRIHSSNTLKGLTTILEESLPRLVDLANLK